MYDTVNIWRYVAVATGLFQFHFIPIGFDWSRVEWRTEQSQVTGRPTLWYIILLHIAQKFIFFCYFG